MCTAAGWVSRRARRDWSILSRPGLFRSFERAPDSCAPHARSARTAHVVIFMRARPHASGYPGASSGCRRRERSANLKRGAAGGLVRKSSWDCWSSCRPTAPTGWRQLRRGLRGLRRAADAEPALTCRPFGSMTFPCSGSTAGFDHSWCAKNPPIHTGGIGLLNEPGILDLLRQARVVCLMLLLCVAAIVTECFPAPVKLGLLFLVGFLAAAGDSLTLCFGTRPEVRCMRSGSWASFAESARWTTEPSPAFSAGPVSYLGFGRPLLRGFAFAAWGVYLVWAVRSLGCARPRTRDRVVRGRLCIRLAVSGVSS